MSSLFGFGQVVLLLALLAGVAIEAGPFTAVGFFVCFVALGTILAEDD